MIASPVRHRGEVWMADLDPTRGHEQAGRRPVLVVSDDHFNQGPAGLVIVCPLTRTIRPLRTIVRIDPPNGGVVAASGVLAHQVRTISVDRLLRRWGVVSSAVQDAVSRIIRDLIP